MNLRQNFSLSNSKKILGVKWRDPERSILYVRVNELIRYYMDAERVIERAILKDISQEVLKTTTYCTRAKVEK